MSIVSGRNDLGEIILDSILEEQEDLPTPHAVLGKLELAARKPEEICKVGLGNERKPPRGFALFSFDLLFELLCKVFGDDIGTVDHL